MWPECALWIREGEMCVGEAEKVERKERGEREPVSEGWHPGPLSLGETGSQREPFMQEQQDRKCTLERATGCSE